MWSIIIFAWPTCTSWKFLDFMIIFMDQDMRKCQLDTNVIFTQVMFCGAFLWHVPLVQLKNIGALGYKQNMHDLYILLVYRSHITLPFNGFIIISYTGLQRWDPPTSSTFYATFYEMLIVVVVPYSISQEICTRFLLFCALLWLYIDWFSHIHQAYFTGTVAI